jgi:hypothetical protein
MDRTGQPMADPGIESRAHDKKKKMNNTKRSDLLDKRYI